MVSEYDRAKRMLEKYPTDADVAYFARKYARREARKMEAGSEVHVVLKEVIDAWTAGGNPPPTITPLVTRALSTIIDQHGVEAATQRLVAGISSQSPAFLWKDGCPALTTLLNQYDAIPAHGMMTAGDLFCGGVHDGSR